MNYKHILSSLILHIVALVAPLLIYTQLGGNPAFLSNNTAMDIVPNQNESYEIDITLDDIGLDIAEEESDPSCEGGHWYGGIGIHQASLDGTIGFVAEGYPAHKAGILVGDRIMAVSDSDIRGTPGTVVKIMIDRQGKTLFFEITRGKICYEEKKRP